ncbi:MAG: ABC transporter ATP-binding protein [Gammaproteobacteria bacterium]|nr:ABC transporter ATP-binding protein [Gammaproteobacteria bacterium]
MLRLESLSCGYGQFCAVHELSLQVEQGSVFALVGANGAGKSSTIMAIAGHVGVQGGRIVLDAHDITTMPIRDRVRAGIAIVPEGRKLFPDLSVEENLMVGGYTRSRGQAENTKTKVFDLFPRIAERRKQTAGSLSGGEQQMVAIGRGLMAEPKLLMIDEVSLGLMPKMVDICYQAIRRLEQEGMTILLVEQSTKRALEISHQVCVLESGRAVWQGPATEARDDPALIEAYLGMREETA